MRTARGYVGLDVRLTCVEGDVENARARVERVLRTEFEKEMDFESDVEVEVSEHAGVTCTNHDAHAILR